MPELLAILEAKRKADNEEKRFLASLQGIDLGKETAPAGTKTIEDVQKKVLEEHAGIDDSMYDLVQKDGFGIGAGLGYRQE